MTVIPVEQGEEQRFHGVVPVMAEGQFVAACFHTGICQHGPAHFGAQGAGIFFFPVIEDDIPDFGSFNDIRDFKGVTEGNDPGVIRTAEAVVHRDCLQGKILVGESAVKGQGVQQQERILAAGHADGHPVTILNQTEIRIRLPDTAQRLFHGRSSSMIRILSDWVWHR